MVLCCRIGMGIRNPVPFHRVAAVADPQVITNLVVDHLHTRKHVLDHFLVHLVAMVASTKAVQDIHTPDHVLGLVHILEIADVVIVAIPEDLVQDAADM